MTCGKFKHLLHGWCGKSYTFRGYFFKKYKYETYICKKCRDPKQESKK